MGIEVVGGSEFSCPLGLASRLVSAPQVEQRSTQHGRHAGQEKRVADIVEDAGRFAEGIFGDSRLPGTGLDLRRVQGQLRDQYRLSQLSCGVPRLLIGRASFVERPAHREQLRHRRQENNTGGAVGSYLVHEAGQPIGSLSRGSRAVGYGDGEVRDASQPLALIAGLHRHLDAAFGVSRSVGRATSRAVGGIADSPSETGTRRIAAGLEDG